MKKFSLLLAVLLLVGMLAACDSEEAEKPKFTVPGYGITFQSDLGFKAVEDSKYDLELTADGITMLVTAYVPTDFVDTPTAEDLYVENNGRLLDGKTEISVKEKESTSTVKGKTVITTLYSAKDGDTTKQYYCCMVSFNNGADTMAWVTFVAKADTMKKNQEAFDAILESMTCNAEAPAEGDVAIDEEPLFNENGELITEETTGEETITGEEDIPDDSEEMLPQESNPPEPTTEDIPTTEPGETTAATQPAETTAPTE